MIKKVLNILVCPKCKNKLNLRENKKDKFLFCSKCKKKYYILNGIIIFKAGVYVNPVVRPRNFSLKELKRKIREGKSKKYFGDFVRRRAEKDTSKYFPRKIENKIFEELLKLSKVRKSKIHLDWATGAGRFVRYVLRKTKRAFFVTLDLDIRECSALRKYIDEKTSFGNRVLIICGDSKEMPFKSCSFDSLTSYAGLDEQVESERAVRESIRILKKSKVFALSGALEGKSFRKLSKDLEKRIQDFKKIFKKLNRTNKLKKIQSYFIYEEKKVSLIDYILSGEK